MRWPNCTPWREKAGSLPPASRTFLAGCRRVGERLWQLVQACLPGRREAAEWAGRLEAEQGSLLTLVRGMEAEFLATGEGLQVLTRQLKAIQQECQSLTGLTLGQTPDAPVQFAFQLLKKAEDLVLASYEQYEYVFATFSALRQRLAQLPRQRDDLLRVLLPLNFITTAFRIEASRHPPEVREVFCALAATVTETVNKVRDALERQFEILAASERIARNLMEQVNASLQQHRKEVAATLQSSRYHLGALNEALTRSGAGATDLSQLNQAVTRHIGGIVMAQQCQDITRQQIEHVGEAMAEMRAHLVAGPPRTSATPAATRQFVFRAAQIQLQQVQNVFDELNRAADGLQSGIRSLRTEAGAAAEVAVQVGGTTLDAKVASQCQTSLGGILAIVAQAVQTIAEIPVAFEPLQAGFFNCTSKATELARDVRYAALNAQIFAVHAPDGATLGVLAGHMRVISDDAIQQVEQLGAALQFSAAMLDNLRQRLEDFQLLGRAEQEVLTEESALSRNKLSNLEGAIPLLIERVTQQQVTFAQSVEEVLANVRFPVTVAEASARFVGFFQDLVAWGSAGGAGLAAESAASENIARLKSKYTMASERHAHTAALQPVPAAASASDSELPIEWFGEWASGSPAAPAAPGALGEMAPQIERPEDPSRPVDVSPRAIAPPAPAHSPASEKSAAHAELGDNVELF